MAAAVTANMAAERPTARVSVVIPCYCCHKSIENAVASIVAQTWLPKQIILVDDCSSDAGLTLRKLEAIKQRHFALVEIIILALQKNVGAGEARNAGWDVATQDFIAFLDADDSWHPEKLELQFGWMIAHTGYSFSCHKTVQYNELTAQVTIATAARCKEIRQLPLLLTNSIPTRSVMIRRTVLHRFPQNVRHAEDYWLWLQIIFNGGKAMKLQLPLAYSFKREFGEEGLSANLFAMHRRVLSCFAALHLQRRVSSTVYVAAVVVETIKYWRRTLLVFIRNHKSKWRAQHLPFR